MTNYAINLIWFTYDAANHKKKKMAKQRNRQCGKDLLLTTSSVYGTHKKEDIELFIEKANAYHPIHI